MGASGVDVGGTFYDVQFLDGTCIDLYNGCDDVSDFTFQTQAAAILAAQALLDQVILDGGVGQFDSQPGLTFGCISLAVFCDVLTPYAFPIPGFPPPHLLRARWPAVWTELYMGTQGAQHRTSTLSSPVFMPNGLFPYPSRTPRSF
jgi:hypothetical protein